MVFLSSARLSWLALALAGSAVSQTQTSSNAADGLKTGAATSTSVQSSNTIEISGTPRTFRVIPTLPASIDETQPVQPNINDPRAVNAQDVCPGYKLASDPKQNQHGFTADLTLAGQPCSAYGNDVHDLALTVEYQAQKRLLVKVAPKYLGAKNATQYIINPDYVDLPKVEHNAGNAQSTSDLKFEYVNSPSFGFAVSRKSNGDVLFDTRGKKLVFEDQFVEFSTSIYEGYNVYGLGEHIHSFRLGNNFTATIYAADIGDTIDDNLYGSHPIYVDTRYYEKGNSKPIDAAKFNATSTYTSQSHAVYLRNTHGQEILMRPDHITWRILGGSAELYFYDGPSVPDLLKNYHASTVGLPKLEQYWAFGFHQCRWGYTNWTNLQEVVDNYRRFNIPLETIWTDIDYMNQYRDFDNDQIRFSYPEGKKFLDKLHAAGQHYVPIIDSAIYIPNPNNASDAYGTYNRGNESGVFVNNADGSQYIGSVWPGYTVFPDWTAAKAVEWWSDEIYRWYQDVKIDGIWIDMSEVSSFCVGSCGSGKLEQNPVHPPFGLPGEKCNVMYDYPEGFSVSNATEAAAASSGSASQSAACATSTASASGSSTTNYLRTTPTPGVRNEAFPPYVINNGNGALPVHALSPNATHADGTADYDIHNIWGHQILNATNKALQKVFPGKRPFIIGRSTFAGSGKYAGHWGGDNYSQWRYMFFSIPQALSFSIFGIPMFGVDTCGFNGNSDSELCSRWMQLSAFFPFYRNHNTLKTIDQEAYVWSDVIDAAKTAMHIRYSLLPYMYTLFYQAHTTGSTVMRALAWEFPNDPSLAAADRQFLLGPSILVTPVLQPQATSVNGVFPDVGKGTVWYDWYTQEAIKAEAGKNVSISAPLGHIPVYVRGGSVLPLQEPGYTTSESRKNPFNIIGALSSNGTASGSLYLDDGESLEPSATRQVQFEISKNALCATGKGSFKDSNRLANVTILGVKTQPRKVQFNGCAVNSFQYNSTSHVLSVTQLGNLTSGGAWTKDFTLTWA